MGYSDQQIKDLEETINAVDCEAVVCATPINLNHLLSLNKPTVRVHYEYRDHGRPTLEEVLMRRIKDLIV